MATEHASTLHGDLQDQQVAGYESPLGVTQTTTLTLPGFRTQSGFRFEAVDVNYQTLGTLSPARDNAVLVCHGLSGNAHVAGTHPKTGRPGWWDFHVGPGKAIDTDKFFVISSNTLGGCSGTTGPGSLNPLTRQPFAMDFPRVTVRDMVQLQAELLDHLRVQKLFAVVGASMGGMQALTWAVHLPQRVRICVPIATCTAHNAMQIAFNEIGRQAIIADSHWNGGRYSEARFPAHGLAVARMVGHVTYLSELAMARKFGRRRQADAADHHQFSIESYLQHQGDSFVKRFDPNSYLYLTRAIDEFNLFEDAAPDEILRRVQARFLVISFSSDWLYPPPQSRELVRQLKRAGVAVTYLNLESEYGHDSFLIDNPPFADVLGHFLNGELASVHGHGTASPIASADVP
ncbi:MAG: homoserine O-acetyltransferase [Verrucomicrobiota bacterium]|jgi:homoserine O-acetyltransferase